MNHKRALRLLSIEEKKLTLLKNDYATEISKLNVLNQRLDQLKNSVEAKLNEHADTFGLAERSNLYAWRGLQEEKMQQLQQDCEQQSLRVQTALSAIRSQKIVVNGWETLEEKARKNAENEELKQLFQTSDDRAMRVYRGQKQ